MFYIYYYKLNINKEVNQLDSYIGRIKKKYIFILSNEILYSFIR